MKNRKSLILTSASLALAGLVLVGGCALKSDEDEKDQGAENVQPSTGWRTETADDSGWVGIDPSIAVDTAGNPSISYYDEDNHDLKYAWKVDGSWQNEVVESEGDIGEESGLTIDNQGNVHVSYISHDQGALKYAKKSGGSWDVSTIDNDNSHHVVTTSITLDSKGYPHIAYNWESGTEYGNNSDNKNNNKDSDIVNDGDSDNNNGNGGSFIKYASWNGNSWNIEKATTGGSDVYLALDNQDQPHICFIKDEPDSDPLIHYVSKSTGAWQTSIVDSETKSGGDCGIDVDTAGHVHITYHDYGQKAIKYAERTGDAWEIQVAARDTGRQEGLRMVVDSGDQPHIIFANDQQEKLIHATLIDDSWEQETINRMGIPSVAIDDDNHLHVAHGYTVDTDNLEDETEILKYSTKD